MAVAELLNEIAKPDYDGLADADVVAALNTWQRVYVPCATKALSIMFAQIGLQGRVEVARDKGDIDDALWLRWKMLLGVMADPDIPTVMFDAKPILIADFFDSLLTLAVIDQTQHIWLTDLGVRSWTAGRKIYARDVKETDIVAAKELAALHAKVQSRREAVEADRKSVV